MVVCDGRDRFAQQFAFSAKMTLDAFAAGAGAIKDLVIEGFRHQPGAR